MLLGSAYGKVSLDASGVQSGVTQAVTGMQTLQAAAERVGMAMTQAGQMLTLGVTLPIVAFLGTSVKAAADNESAMADLNAVIKSTGGVAGVTAKAVTDYATAMQKVTKYDDEATITGDAMLLTFTNIGKDVFPAASDAMLNMAEKFGSIKEASIQVGKALQDPILGLTNLRRVGVIFTTQQEDQIKHFMAVNDIASAQKMILKELETEFGGLAKAAGDTTAGKFSQLKNAMGEFQESIGKALIPVLLPIIKGLTDMANAFAAMPLPVQQFIITALLLLAALGPVLTILGTLITTINGLVTIWPLLTAGLSAMGIALPGIGAGLAGAGAGASGAAAGFGALAISIGSIVLPLLAVIAVVYLFYAVWTTNLGGIQTTTAQLVFIIQYWFGQMGVTVSQICDLFKIAWNGGVYQTLEITWQFIKNVFMWQLQNLWNLIKGIAWLVGSYFRQAWINLVAVFQWVIDKVRLLGAAFSSLKIPSWLTPGSPTPLEIGLIGITKALHSANDATRAWGQSQMALRTTYLAEMAAGQKMYAMQVAKMPASQLAAMNAAQLAAQNGTAQIDFPKTLTPSLVMGQGSGSQVTTQDTYLKKGQVKDTYLQPSGRSSMLTINNNYATGLTTTQKRQLQAETEKNMVNTMIKILGKKGR